MKKIAIFAGLLVLCAARVLPGAGPLWWEAYGVAGRESAVEENYRAANAGQLKNMAKKAALYLDLNFPGGAGPRIDALIASFGAAHPPEEIAGNYRAINLGQLKAVAKPFYDRLRAGGYDTRQNLIDHGYPASWAHDYPWDPATPAAVNYAAANLGQLKMAFCFNPNEAGMFFIRFTRQDRRISFQVQSETFNANDQVVRNTVNEWWVSDFAVAPIFLGPPQPVTWESSNPDLAMVDSSGRVTGIASGTATIIARTPSGTGAPLDLAVTRYFKASGADIVGWRPGTASFTAFHGLVDLLAGKNPAAALPLYATKDHQNGPDGVYVRNPGCWAAGLDTTCISVAHRRAGDGWSTFTGITAITPRHVIQCAHSYSSTGTDVRFVTAGNVVVTRKILATTGLPKNAKDLGSPDIVIGVLDADLPSTIRPCGVLPANVAARFPVLNDPDAESYGLPTLGTDQEAKAHVREWAREPVDLTVPTYQTSAAIGPYPSYWPDLYHYGNWSEGLVGGDSGHPCFLVYDGQLGLIAVWTLAGGQGTSVRAYLPKINAAIGSLDASVGISTGYTPVPISL